MENELKLYLKTLDIADSEIEEMESICPGLEFVDSFSALENLKILIDAGYPECDLDSILYINPGILLYSTDYLKDKISSLNGDIETILKNDPYAI